MNLHSDSFPLSQDMICMNTSDQYLSYVTTDATWYLPWWLTIEEMGGNNDGTSIEPTLLERLRNRAPSLTLRMQLAIQNAFRTKLTEFLYSGVGEDKNLRRAACNTALVLKFNNELPWFFSDNKNLAHPLIPTVHHLDYHCYCDYYCLDWSAALDVRTQGRSVAKGKGK